MNDAAYLVLDDDPDILKAARLALSREAARIDLADLPAGLEERLAKVAYDAVLMDMNFAPGERSGGEGLDALARIRAADPHLSVVLMTTYGGVALAVEGLKRGAADFVLKPWRNDALAASMAAAAAATRERRATGAELNLDLLERRAVERALAACDGNISHAAAALGLTRPALYRRMARRGL